jgi:hypothetical protein
MATVRLNKDILYHVCSKVNELTRKNLDGVLQQLHEIQCAGEIYMSMFTDEERRRANELNDQPNGPWVNTVEDVYISIRATNGKSLTFPNKFRPPVVMPLKLSGMYHKVLELLPEHSNYPRALQLADAYYHIEASGLTAATEIKRMFSVCSTLKQLLEMWPAALDYMPEHVVRQHHEPSPKKMRNSSIKDSLPEEEQVIAGEAVTSLFTLQLGGNT